MGKYDHLIAGKTGTNTPTSAGKYDYLVKKPEPAKTKAQPKPRGGVLGGLQEVVKDVTEVVRAPFPKQEWNPMRAFDTASDAVADTLEDTFNRYKKSRAAYASPTASVGEKVVAQGELTMGLLNTIFAPIVAPLQGAAKLPVIGSAAELVNRFFGVLGTVGSAVGEGGVEALPVSDETKARITPLAQEVGALVAVVKGGSATLKQVQRLRGKSRELATEIDADMVNQGVVAPEPIKQPVEPVAPPKQATPRATESPSDPLLTEARKGERLYHGTNDMSWVERGESIKPSETSFLGNGGVFFDKNPQNAKNWITASGGYSKAKAAGKMGGVVELKKVGGGDFNLKKLSEGEYEQMFLDTMKDLRANPAKYGTDKYGVNEPRGWKIVNNKLKEQGFDGVDFGKSDGVLFDPKQISPVKLDPLMEEARKYKSAAEFEYNVMRADKGGKGLEYKGIPHTSRPTNDFAITAKLEEGKINWSQARTSDVPTSEWMQKIKSGERPPVVVGTDSITGKEFILDGHNRLQAYRKLGIEEIPTITQSQLTDIWKKAQEADAVSPVKAEQVPNTRAQTLEKAAVEKKLTDSLGELPTHERMNMSDQATRAVDFIERNPEQSLRVIRGEAVPEGVLPEALYTAMEIKAIKNGDVAMLKELSNSTIPTTAGQAMKALDSADPNSPVKIMRDIQQAREAKIEKRTGKKKPQAVKEVVDEIKKEVQKSVSKRPSWDEFIRSIECR